MFRRKEPYRFAPEAICNTSVMPVCVPVGGWKNAGVAVFDGMRNMLVLLQKTLPYYITEEDV
jgi:hypothetical protein